MALTPFELTSIFCAQTFEAQAIRIKGGRNVQTGWSRFFRRKYITRAYLSPQQAVGAEARVARTTCPAIQYNKHLLRFIAGLWHHDTALNGTYCQGAIRHSRGNRFNVTFRAFRLGTISA